jgi:curved DNA-binding protein CbpA
LAEQRDPYRVLGVAPGSAPREIRDAYRHRARMAHPDLAGDESASWMRDLNAAWEILKDPARRAEYDAAAGRGAANGSADGAGGAGSGSGGAVNGPDQGREPWHGAAGRPPGPAYGTTLESGIYAGWSLAQVSRRDRGYLTWLRERPEGRRYSAEIDRILGSGSRAPDGPSSDRGSRRRGR